MKNELVSVIIPTHGRASSLERALVSVKNQSYSNIEIIVVDDNSEDTRLRERVKDIATKYGARVLLNRKPMGGSGTRNHGLNHAKGDYVAFLDDDDEMLPTKIEKQLELFHVHAGDNVGMIYCYADYIYSKKTEPSKKDYEGVPLKEHLISCIAATSWWFCPKNVLINIGGFSDYSSHQDAITLFKMLLKGYSIYRVPEVLLHYYAPDGNGITKISNEWVDVEREYLSMYLENKDRFNKKDNKEIQYSFYYRLAYCDYILKNKKKFFSETCRLMRLRPFRKKTIEMIGKCALTKIRSE